MTLSKPYDETLTVAERMAATIDALQDALDTRTRRAEAAERDRDEARRDLVRLARTEAEYLVRADIAEAALADRPAPEHWRAAITMVLGVVPVGIEREIEAEARRRAAEASQP